VDEEPPLPPSAQGCDEESCSKPTVNRIVGDEIRLRQVLRNLISNALKFTPSGKPITISLKYVKTEPIRPLQTQTFTLKDGQEVEYPSSSNALQILVQDQGAGLTKTQLGKLFSDGIQFNPNELQAGHGSGLGLFITRGIVEQHGGMVQAMSEGLRKGATFEVILPLYQVPGSAPTEVESQSSSPMESTETVGESQTLRSTFKENHVAAKKACQRILIVDDALSNRKLMRRLLEHHGHNCEVAEDGKEAIQVVQEASQRGEPFDTILMDFEMPIMNGPTATEHIRSQKYDTFIVGVTGNMFPEDVEQFLASGANAVLPKPFRMNALVALWDKYNICQGFQVDVPTKE